MSNKINGENIILASIESERVFRFFFKTIEKLYYL